MNNCKLILACILATIPSLSSAAPLDTPNLNGLWYGDLTVTVNDPKLDNALQCYYSVRAIISNDSKINWSAHKNPGSKTSCTNYGVSDDMSVEQQSLVIKNKSVLFNRDINNTFTAELKYSTRIPDSRNFYVNLSGTNTYTFSIKSNAYNLASSANKVTITMVERDIHIPN